ncbi:hypothetical protein SUGI_0687700 [Cryptomeria japonica]|uniref:uncharacterized protein LOC131056617 n=1 Tax=Cryptomeria japonica TaxID=3369 RepID=UPI0024147BEC|nr:uncharacterized protein LOC131056617 [Cryptomeria japonica]GLJ34221.1 hypothetical protein SUGI_0687700 [Cryptomeria japonica]
MPPREERYQNQRDRERRGELQISRQILRRRSEWEAITERTVDEERRLRGRMGTEPHLRQEDMIGILSELDTNSSCDFKSVEPEFMETQMPFQIEDGEVQEIERMEVMGNEQIEQTQTIEDIRYDEILHLFIIDDDFFEFDSDLEFEILLFPLAVQPDVVSLQMEEEARELVDAFGTIKIYNFDINEVPLCSVCRIEYEVGEEACQMPCHKTYIFHSDCLRQWLEGRKSCPLCKTGVPYPYRPPFVPSSLIVDLKIFIYKFN